MVQNLSVLCQIPAVLFFDKQFLRVFRVFVVRAAFPT